MNKYEQQRVGKRPGVGGAILVGYLASNSAVSESRLESE